MSHREVEPSLLTASPIGGLAEVDDLASGELAVFGDESLRLAADRDGVPAVPYESERVISRWVAESSSSALFEILGTWFVGGHLQQGTLATGASDNYLLLTDAYVRGAVPPGGAVQTNTGVTAVSAGHVYLFAMRLVEIKLIDGNKRDIAFGGDVEAVRAQWIRSCDASWAKIRYGNPWHRDNAPFAQAVLTATIAAKLGHSDERVRASATQAQTADMSKAFATGRRTTFEFAVP